MKLKDKNGNEFLAALAERSGSVIYHAEQDTGCKTMAELEKYIEDRYSAEKQYQVLEATEKEKELIQKHNLEWLIIPSE